jgi:ATP-dependent DNA helicase RecG
MDNKHVIKVEFNGDECPYSASGRYYLRTADEDREVTPMELKQFFVANEYKEKWEKTKTDISVKNVDKKAVKKFCDEAISVGRMADGKYTVPTVLSRFGLVNGDCLTNAGNVLFGNTHPITLKAAVFATDEKLTFLDMQMYEDNIYNLLKISETYILSNIRWKAEIVGVDRDEEPEIPVSVIREVLANSFAHAVYKSNTYHEICIHPSKITIYSPGAFASSYKPEDYIIHNCQSSIRNATIAKILYLNKSIEQFGSGFKRINSLCKDAKIKYSYEASDVGFNFIIFRNTTNEIHDDMANNINLNVTLNETEKAVYGLIAVNPYYTRNELAVAVSKTVRTVQRALDSLKDKGLIERVGSDKNGYWKSL